MDRHMKQQRGISLIVVLIGLVIISFAAVALLRSSDTATLIAGNLGFKKAALASGDAGTEAAIAWLNANSAGITLQQDREANGYYATTTDACDLTGSRTPGATDDNVDWTGASPEVNCNVSALRPNPQPAGVAADYEVSFIINRMCNAEGNSNSATAADGVTPMICSRADADSSGASSQVGPTYSRRPFSGSTQTYYRITTRIIGPRGTVRYTQAFVVL
jgi:type IV pilus assembly protein PilX